VLPEILVNVSPLLGVVHRYVIASVKKLRNKRSKLIISARRAEHYEIEIYNGLAQSETIPGMYEIAGFIVTDSGV